MKIMFTVWSADELIQSYVDFIKKKNSKELFIKYGSSNRQGFEETMKGQLETTDVRLKSLPKKVQYQDAVHSLKLFQKKWKVSFSLSLFKDFENDYRNKAILSFDKSLQKEVYRHFKEFSPEKASIK